MTDESSGLPLRIVVLGDFAPRDPAQGARLWDVDKDRLSDVLRTLSPRPLMEVKNRFGETPPEVPLSLAFPELKAFRPEGLAGQIPSLAALLWLREAVVAYREGKTSEEDVTQAVRSTELPANLQERILGILRRPKRTGDRGPRPPEPSQAEKAVAGPEKRPRPPQDAEAGGGIDSILSMVEAPREEEPSAVGRAVDALTSAVLGSRRSTGADPAAVREILEAIDAPVGGMIEEILHHDGFRRIESSWRGLEFLIDRTDFRKNIRIQILSAPKEHLGAAFKEKIFEPEMKGLRPEPVSVVIGDYEFDNSPEDIDLLDEIAGMAEGLQAPFISGLSPGFFGLETLADLPTLPTVDIKLQGPEYAKWNSFRSKEASRWVALIATRFLLRYAYGPDRAPVRGFDLREETAGRPELCLWGNGAWAVGSLLTGSFARTGWCVEITGVRTGGAVESLPTWRRPGEPGAEIEIPLEALLPDRRLGEFTDAGIMVLATEPNRDAAYLVAAPSVHRPEIYSDTDATAQSQVMATITHQLLSGRIAHGLRGITHEIRQGAGDAEIEAAFRRRLGAVFPSPEEARSTSFGITVRESEGRPGIREVTLKIQPPYRILGRPVTIALMLEIRE